VILKVWLESVFTYNFNFVVYLGYRNFTFFPYQPFLRFQAQVPSTFYVRVCESSIQTYTIGACWNTFKFNLILNVNSEILKGRGLLVMIYKLYYAGIAFTMKMNSDDKILCDNGI
jgi:hypothetical protein